MISKPSTFTMITKLCASMKSCHRPTCACYNNLKPLRKNPTLDMWLVMNKEYKEYKECYKQVEGDKKDIFLL